MCERSFTLPKKKNVEKKKWCGNGKAWERGRKLFAQKNGFSLKNVPSGLRKREKKNTPISVISVFCVSLSEPGPKNVH